MMNMFRTLMLKIKTIYHFHIKSHKNDKKKILRKRRNNVNEKDIIYLNNLIKWKYTNSLLFNI